jgi:hypothetical protein
MFFASTESGLDFEIVSDVLRPEAVTPPRMRRSHFLFAANATELNKKLSVLGAGLLRHSEPLDRCDSLAPSKLATTAVGNLEECAENESSSVAPVGLKESGNRLDDGRPSVK